MSLAWYRKRAEALRRIAADVRARGAEQLGARRFPRRALVLNFFPANRHAFWVVEGRVRLAIFDADGVETSIAILEAGELFGRVDDAAVGAVLAETLETSTVAALDPEVLAAFATGPDRGLRELAVALDRAPREDAAS